MEAERVVGAGVSMPEDTFTLTKLPGDILFDVLTWLPAKSLCRFRCVSKRWRAIISEPAFVAAHGSRAAPLVIGVFDGPRKFPTLEQAAAGAPVVLGATLELRLMDMDGNVHRVVEDVERKKLSRTRLDLVCLDGELYGAKAIDPETGRAVAIRGYVDDPPASIGAGICYSGFGRATPSGVYKAVRLVVAHMEAKAQVATLDGGGELTWRQGPAAPFLLCCCPSCTPIVDGVLYSMPRDVHGFVPDRNRVAAFDLEKEEWKPVIKGPKESISQLALVGLQGTLAMVHSEGEWAQTEIWFLADSEKSIWIKKHVIQMHESWFLIKPLEVLSDGRILLLNLVQKQEQNPQSLRWVLQLRNPSTGTHTDLMEMPPECRGRLTIYRGRLLC